MQFIEEAAAGRTLVPGLDGWMTSSEASQYLRRSQSWLAKLRVFGGGPRFYKPSGRLVLYQRADLDEWAASKSFNSTSEYKLNVGKAA